LDAHWALLVKLRRVLYGRGKKSMVLFYNLHLLLESLYLWWGKVVQISLAGLSDFEPKLDGGN
jgi:hypothetical protein